MANSELSYNFEIKFNDLQERHVFAEFLTGREVET